MRPRIDLRFRPGLLLFIDDIGRAIYEQFQAILRLAPLDSILCQGIALLHYASDTHQAQRLPLTHSLVQDTTLALPDLLEEAIKEVQASKCITAITRAGYPVPNPRAQVYIIGDPAHSPLPEVLHIIQTRLAFMKANNLVCYVLHTDLETGALPAHLSPHSLHEFPTPLKPLVGNASFCYLYQGELTHPTLTFLSENETHYITAEALYALLATGITTEPFFEKIMCGGAVSDAHLCVGSLGTSLILCPHDTILHYCSMRLGIDLLTRWLKNINEPSIPASRSKEIQAGAHNLVSSLAEWIYDTQERPLANGPQRLWHTQRPDIGGRRFPSLAILGRISRPEAHMQIYSVEYTRLYRCLYERTRALFACFWPEYLYGISRHSINDTNSWLELISSQASRASMQYKAWNEIATHAWEATTSRIRDEIQATVEQLYLLEDSGFLLAGVYIKELDAWLQQVQAYIECWHYEHVHDYETALQDFASRAQISTEMLYASTPEPSQSDQLSKREMTILQHLEERRKIRQSRVPSPLALLLIALPFIFAVLITLPSIYPAAITYMGIGTIIFTILSGHSLFAYQRGIAAREAREDILSFYRRYYAYHCELCEDLLRQKLLDELQKQIRILHIHLDTLTEKLSKVHNHLTKEISIIQTNLFKSPASIHDFLVANGDPLQEKRQNTLEDVSEQAHQARTSSPTEDWHHAISSIQRRFLTGLVEQDQNIMTLAPEDLLDYLTAFTHEIARPYCTGDLVEIHAALGKPEVWHAALSQASNQLYQSGSYSAEQYMTFICGREADLQKGSPHFPENAYPVYISDAHPWLLIATFSQGEALAMENTDAPTRTQTRIFRADQ
ncbi:hypothetical protein [Ktedonospora formicarum]|uniref:Uncharacterized protein n=1 Tax=Ktedonospora formicarum TaxID=2778364 RepID=A0A8J3I527_9CHLR|nr:hypothetical protein [Ktedonospora formicarum]GHO46297.1 hypothetical protein KSX_44600 [Ktedonospora formicarum]